MKVLYKSFVYEQIQRSCELVGYFVQPEIWKKLVLTGLRQSLSYGVVMTAAAIVRGSERAALLDHQADLVNAILNPDVSQTIEMRMHVQVVYHQRI